MPLLTKLLNYPFRLKLSSVLFRNWRFAYCGSKVLVAKPLHISYDSISIGNHGYIWKNCRIEAVHQYEGVFFTPSIVFGDNVSIQQNLHLTCASRVEIGANTAIAANVTITDIDHPYTDISIPIEKQCIIVAPVSIGQDCKIYNNSVILQGTTIGKHCIVGANSVVCGVFEDYSVIVGAPAKVVKRYNFETKTWEKLN